MKIKPAFVYVIRQGSGLKKIGFTQNPAQRLKDIKGANPTAVMERLYIGSKSDEGQLHRIFANQRTSREWFRLDAGHMAQIDQFFAKKYLINGPAEYLHAYSIYIADVLSGKQHSENSRRNFDSPQTLFQKQVREKRSNFFVSEKIDPELTESDIENLNKYNINLRTAKGIKAAWSQNPNMSLATLRGITNYSESLCKKILASFRKSIV